MKYMFHSGTNHVHYGMLMGTRGGFMSDLLKNFLHMKGFFSIYRGLYTMWGVLFLQMGEHFWASPPPMGIRSACPQ